MKVSIHKKLALLTLSLATMLLFAGALLVSPMDAQAADVENITGKLADLEADCAEKRADLEEDLAEAVINEEVEEVEEEEDEDIEDDDED